MGKLSDQTIERVKQAIDIVSLIGEYVDLKRSGKNYKACCPFHSEKTPSFMVSEQHNHFHCFGCGEQGDGIGFIMKKENLDFPDAIRFLAQKYGIPIEEDARDTQRKQHRDTLYEINREAMRFYYRALLTDRTPQNYLMGRGFRAEIINTFFLGYADGRGDSLYKHLSAKGFNPEDLLELGLISRSNRGTGYYDRFRNRLMFPIISPTRRIIGFGGRIIGEGQPKYLNSPESEIFHKGENIYGINIVQNRPSRDRILMVEGYMDVIALNLYGIDYAVASLGTALTPEQAKLAHRYGEQIYLCYDGDKAGIKASRRAIEVFAEQDILPRMMLLPDGQDPDEYLKAHGRVAFEARMDEAIDPIDFELRLMRGGYDLTRADHRLSFTLELTRYLAGIDKDAVRELYIRQEAEALEITFESLKADVDAERHKVRLKKEQGRFPTPGAPDPDWQYPNEDPLTEMPGEDPMSEAALFERKMGRDHSDPLAVRRLQHEYEVVRLYFCSSACRNFFEADVIGFVREASRAGLLATMRTLHEQHIPPALPLLRERLSDPQSLALLDRLERDQGRMTTRQDGEWVRNAQELSDRIRRFVKQERRNELNRLVREDNAALDREGLSRGEILREIRALDAELKIRGRK